MTIAALTLRQYTRSRTLLVVAVICLIPILFAILPHFPTGLDQERDRLWLISDDIYLGLFASTLLPLATLVMATAALGNEIEDKTLHYLALKPVSRFRIVFEKWISVVALTTAIVWASLALIWFVAAWGYLEPLRTLVPALLISSLVGILGFGSLFLFLSLVINRALLFGVFYVFIWETTLSRFLPGIRSISISHYTRSTFVRAVQEWLPNERLAQTVTIDSPSSVQTIFIAIALVVVVSLAAATWRLRTMAID